MQAVQIRVDPREHDLDGHWPPTLGARRHHTPAPESARQMRDTPANWEDGVAAPSTLLPPHLATTTTQISVVARDTTVEPTDTSTKNRPTFSINNNKVYYNKYAQAYLFMTIFLPTHSLFTDESPLLLSY
mmetsp:Transcript_12756/g.23077  ORF Transcript_12756/g.23077 Transcript_12756/m.23077 type:complete len:130 (+) Transcript_12756:1628-2017(+)